MAEETDHGWCPTHRIAYLRQFDASCPQCGQQRMTPPPQLDFDKVLQKPVNASAASRPR